MDEKTKERVEKLKDLVMLRFGGTGVHEVHMIIDHHHHHHTHNAPFWLCEVVECHTFAPKVTHIHTYIIAC